MGQGAQKPCLLGLTEGGRELEGAAQARLGPAHESVKQREPCPRKIEGSRERKSGAKRTVSLPEMKEEVAQDLEKNETVEDEGLENPKTKR